MNCFLLGTPRVTGYPFPFKIVQSPKETIILYEAMRTFRDIPTDGRSHSRLPENTFMGESIGHWEDDTLVVDTIGFNDKTWLDHAGRPHSDELHLVERFRRLDHDHLQLDITFDDPKAYARPWNGRKVFTSTDRDFIEHECSMSENEHFRQRMIDGIIAPAKPK